MDEKLKNEKKEAEEQKLENFLEDFPLWKECRKLMNILSGTKDDEELARYFKNTIYGRAEIIFIKSAEIFECIKNGINREAQFNIENSFKELAALRTLIYISFDKGRIYVDNFSEIIIQLSKIRKELEKLKNVIMNQPADFQENDDLKKIFH